MRNLLTIYETFDPTVIRDALHFYGSENMIRLSVPVFNISPAMEFQYQINLSLEMGRMLKLPANIGLGNEGVLFLNSHLDLANLVHYTMNTAQRIGLTTFQFATKINEIVVSGGAPAVTEYLQRKAIYAPFDWSIFSHIYDQVMILREQYLVGGQDAVNKLLDIMEEESTDNLDPFPYWNSRSTFNMHAALAGKANLITEVVPYNLMHH